MTSLGLDPGIARLTEQGYQVETLAQIEGTGHLVRYEVDLSAAGFTASAPDLEAIEPLDTALGLLPAMARPSSLQLNRFCPIAERQSMETLQALFMAWTQGALKRIAICDGPLGGGREPRPGRRVAAFFSGGVDSWYTLLNHQQQIDLLVLVHGFDVPLNRQGVWAPREKLLTDALRAFGKPYILIRTNVREFSDPWVDWPWYHGAAMAAAARILAPFVSRFYFASSFDYANLLPWGSHPASDWLWGTPGVRIEHDGCEVNRLEKVARIAESPEALRSLRVCWQNHESLYNCSVCRKCVLTQLALAAVGALDRASTFDASRLALLIPSLDCDDPAARVFLEEILAFQKRNGQDTLYRRLLGKRMYRRVRRWQKWLSGSSV